jgi:nucleoside-diphosphate-sugar epimerase
MEAEMVVLEYARRGLPTVILRPCMVYGEGEPHMTRFLSGLIRFRLPIPYCPDKLWHMVSVSNLAACLLRCMEDPRASGGIFNVADDEVLTVQDILGIFAQACGVKSPPRLKLPAEFLSFVPFIGRWLNFLCKDRVYSIDRLKEVLNFIPPYRVVPELTRAARSCRRGKQAKESLK